MWRTPTRALHDADILTVLREVDSNVKFEVHPADESAARTNEGHGVSCAAAGLLHDFLVGFYAREDPTKVGMVPMVCLKFQGREA